ncbi:MAG: hypothetical protein R2784_13000 [Saprospiraceae bacterium]
MEPAFAVFLETEANNHFGIKCKSDWTGQSFYKKTMTLMKKEILPNPALDLMAVRKNHSSRPFFVFEEQCSLCRVGFSSMVATIKNGQYISQKGSGYATAPDYANRLISIIEEFELYQYDNEGYTGIVGDNRESQKREGRY